jgi:hypothetical protein
MRHQKFFAMAAMSRHPTPWAPRAMELTPPEPQCVVLVVPRTCPTVRRARWLFSSGAADPYHIGQ